MTLAFNDPYTAFIVRFKKFENIYDIDPDMFKLFGIILFTDFYRLIGISINIFLNSIYRLNNNY